MAQFQVNPLEVVSAPNYYSFLADRQWVITHGQAATLWGQLWVSDSMGQRRFILPNTAAMTISFLRADSPQNPSVSQTVTKSAAVQALDRSMFSFTLSAQDAQTVISGSVIFKITDTGSPSIAAEWVQNYCLKKLMTGPGY